MPEPLKRHNCLFFRPVRFLRNYVENELVCWRFIRNHGTNYPNLMSHYLKEAVLSLFNAII